MRASRTYKLTLFAVVLAASLTPLRRAHAQEEEEQETDTSSEKEETTSSSEGGDSSDSSSEGKETTEKVAESTEERKKLSDRIKSVQRKVFLKKSRVEIFPQFALDLNDPFFQHFIVGGALGFHVVDSLSFEVRGGASVGKIKQKAIQFVRNSASALLENPPEFKYHADIDALWAPFYGKISLFSEAILHFDVYLTAGPGVFGTDAGLNPAANAGLGTRFFMTDWLVARIEIRNYLFNDSRNGTSDLQNLLILGFAISGFFPTTFEYEFQ